ncbi:MAG TPA: hypothetical protein VMZ28_04455, partial [Kofleriaceae bacterium]|nr:hypothetical protein [Kofleriaceae bacterium]
DVIRVATVRSTDDGDSFQSTGFLPLAPGEQGVDPSTTFDSAGTARVAYMTIAPAGRVVYETAFDAGAGTWLPRTQVSDAPAMLPAMLIDAPWLFAGGDTLYVVYTEKAAGGAAMGSVVLARSVSGGTWERSRLAASPAPEVATGAVDALGVVHVVYTDDARGVWYVQSSDGVAFGAPMSVGKAVSATRVGLAVAAGKVFITYFDARPGIVLKRLPGGQTTYLTAGALDFNALHPQVAVTSTGRVAVGFYASDDTILGRWRTYLSDDDGKSFGAGLLVSDADLRLTTSRAWPDWLGDYEGLVGGPGGALYTVWTDNRAGHSHIFFAKLRP